VQTGRPLALAVHMPRQQSPSTTQGVPGSRQAPGPRSHRFVVALHTPEQQLAPASTPEQPSPDALHVVLESSVQDPLSQDDEQHSSSIMQLVPATLQVAPPHVPPWQSSAQQSWCASQRAPSAAQ